MHIEHAECAFPESSQYYKASGGTFEATVLEKRSWNGTKAQRGAAWEDTEDRTRPPRSDGKPQFPAFKGKDEDRWVGVSSLSSRNKT